MIFTGIVSFRRKKDFDQVCLGHMNDGQCLVLTTGEREREREREREPKNLKSVQMYNTDSQKTEAKD